MASHREVCYMVGPKVPRINHVSYKISYEMFSMPVYNLLQKCDNFCFVLICDLCMWRDSHQETNSEELLFVINLYPVKY